MKPYPFRRTGVHDFILREHADLFHSIRAEVARRLESVEDVYDGRFGFGTVYIQGHEVGCLQTWKWRHADPADYPSWLSATMFVDEPVGLTPDTSFTARCIVAEEFAAVASAALESKRVLFHARPLQIVAAGPDRPAGIRRGEDADELAIELHLGVPTPRIIDRLVVAEFERVTRLGCLVTDYECFQGDIWHHAERVNAARAILGLGKPDIKVPGLAAIKRRVLSLRDAQEQDWAAQASR